MHLDPGTFGAALAACLGALRIGEYLLARLRNSADARHEKADRIAALEKRLDELHQQVGALQQQLAEERIAHGEQTARLRIEIARLERELANMTTERDQLARDQLANAATIDRLEGRCITLSGELDDLRKRASAAP